MQSLKTLEARLDVACRTFYATQRKLESHPMPERTRARLKSSLVDLSRKIESLEEQIAREESRAARADRHLDECRELLRGAV